MSTELGTRAGWLKQVFADNEARLVKYAFSIVGDRELARDVVQDVFIKLCEADVAQIESYVRPWLYRVCRNRALDVVKGKQQMKPADQEFIERAPSGEPSAQADLETQEGMSFVRQAFEDLPDLQREVLRLRIHEELSYQEISRAMGITVSHVGVLIHTAMVTLRGKVRKAS